MKDGGTLFWRTLPFQRSAPFVPPQYLQTGEFFAMRNPAVLRFEAVSLLHPRQDIPICRNPLSARSHKRLAAIAPQVPMIHAGTVFPAQAADGPRSGRLSLLFPHQFYPAVFGPSILRRIIAHGPNFPITLGS